MDTDGAITVDAERALKTLVLYARANRDNPANMIKDVALHIMSDDPLLAAQILTDAASRCIADVRVQMARKNR